MLNCLFLVIPLVYIFFYSKFWNKKIYEGVVFGLITFLGVNSFYFFVVSIFNLELSILVLFFLNIGYCLLIYFAGRKNKSKTKENKNGINYGLIIAIVSVLLSILFVINLKTFSNGFRIPIPSYTEDASQHFHIILNSINFNKLLESFYPFAFHGNAWLFIKVATQIFNKTNDMVFITNVFALYIWLIIFLTISLISIIVFDLINIENKSKFYWKIIVPFFTLITGSVVSLYFIEYGFFSNWLNQLFSLAIIYLLSREESISIVLSLPLLFGFFFSYSFFVPILVVFYGYLYFSKKEKKYLYLSLISLILSIIFLVEISSTVGGLNYLVVAGGGFPTYSNTIILTYILLSCLYCFFIKSQSKKNRTLDYLSFLGIVFFIYSLGLAVLQLILNGTISYSFHKAFASSFLFFGILATAGFIVFIISFFSEKKGRILPALIFVKSIILVLIVMMFSNCINPPLTAIFQGKGNFFSNEKGRFNAVIYALENFSDFKNVIYVDGDYQSTRWATLSYLPVKFNVIYDKSNVLNFKNYSYYISQLKQLDSTTLILNPTRFLEVDCESEDLIKIATQSAKISIYPFDLDNFNRNCHKKVVIKNNE